MTSPMQPLVSIIVPVYNVEAYVDECLASIRAQTYSNLEILLVEDCSTDESLKALEPHLEDPRIRLIRHERNGGLSAARNTGIEAATGDYVMFVDSDDLINVGLVRTCVQCVKQSDAEVVAYRCTPFIDGEVLVREDRIAEVPVVTAIASDYFRLPHFAWLKFIQRSLLRDPELRFPNGLFYEDWPFHWKLGLLARQRLLLDVSLYHYRQRPTSITGSTGRKLLDLFTVQSKVLAMFNGVRDVEACRILVGKIRDSHWSVLTRIDDNLLREALALAQDADRALSSRCIPIDRAWRRGVIEEIVKFPAPIALPTLRIIRAALSSLSSSRRRAVRRKPVETLT